MELLLRLAPKAAPEPRRAIAVTPEDLIHHPGAYQNGEQRLEIVAKENRLILKRDRAIEAPLVKHTGARYAVESGGPEYILVPGPDGQTEYVHAGSRSFARVH